MIFIPPPGPHPSYSPVLAHRTKSAEHRPQLSAFQNIKMSGRHSASSATATSLLFGDGGIAGGGINTGPTSQTKVFSMYNGRGRSSHAPDFSKRYKTVARSRRGSVQRLVLRWLRRPSTFLLTGFCLLVIPPLWFVSRHAEPTPEFIPELDGGGKGNLRTPSNEGSRRTEEAPPAETDRPLPLPKADTVEVATARIRATAAPPPPPPPPPPPTVPPVAAQEDLDKENERIKRKHSEWRRKATMSPWQPPVLPVEVFRDVPPEECLRNPLTEKRVDSSDYEFGCEDIYVSKKL